MDQNPSSSGQSQLEMPKVYLLPNLMTAGNLFCGFMAISQIIEGSLAYSQIQNFPFQADNALWIRKYELSLKYIMGAFIFDTLDGLMARIGHRESSFGREFDSLADVISFGLAPALLVLKIILVDLPPDYGWVGKLVASIYLLAGAMRLARFNLISSQPQPPEMRKNFIGFPIPAAAGLVSSITLLILTLNEHDKPLGHWIYLLPVLLIFLSYMMYSKITYPSFKSIDWKSKRSIPHTLIIFLILCVILKTWRYSLALVFLAYLIYGFVRPYISKKIRDEIEEEEEQFSS